MSLFYVKTPSNPIILFIEEYKTRRTTFIKDTFGLLSFMKHFITEIGPKLQTLISNRDQIKPF